MSFLAKDQLKSIRRHKILRLATAFVASLIVVELIGLALLMPSYLLLTLSRDDVLRRFYAAEKVLAQKNLKPLRDKIDYVNALLVKYDTEYDRKKPIAGLTAKIANSVPAEIKFKLLNLKMENGGTFSFTLNGMSSNRDVLLKFVEKLKLLPEVAKVASPITNLLKERDVEFVLTVYIKNEFYNYVKH